MIITSNRLMGDNRYALNGDDGKTYHLPNLRSAQAWMAAFTTGLPTLTSIAPTTAVSVSGADLTVTLTGTGFDTSTSQVLVNGNVYPRTFVSATSMTIVLKPSTVPAPALWNISVRNQGVAETVSKPFTFT
jgi:hypothetical protein